MRISARRGMHRVLVALGMALVFAGTLLVPQATAAPSTLYSNLNEGVWKSTNGVYLAQSFETDASTELTSVRLMYRGANEGNSSGSASSFTISIYSASSGAPGTSLATLETVNTAAWANDTYTVSLSSAPALSANTQYFVVVAGAGSGTLGWKYTSSMSSGYVGSAPVAFTSANGSSWSSLASTFFSLEVVAEPATPTPVAPEVGALGNVSATYGDGSQAISNPTASVAGSWSYSSSNNSVFTVAGNTLSVVGAGTATLTADFTPSDLSAYLPMQVTSLVTIARAQPDIVFDASQEFEVVKFPTGFDWQAPVADIAGSWTHSGTGLTLDGDQLRAISAGDFVLESVFTPADAANYEAVTVEQTISVTRRVSGGGTGGGVTPTPTPTPTPTETVSPTPTPTPTTTPNPTPTNPVDPTPSNTSTPAPTDNASEAPSEPVQPTPAPTETATPEPSATPTDSAAPAPTEPPAPSFSEIDVQAVTERVRELFSGDPFVEPAPALVASIDAAVGAEVSEVSVQVEANGLAAGSEVVVTMHSDPIEVYRGVADANGQLRVSVNLPAEVEGGTTHSILVTGVDASGAPVTVAGAVILDAERLVAGVAPAGQISEFDSGAEANLARAAALGVGVYDPRVNVITTAGIAVAAGSLLALGGAGGMARNLPSGTGDSGNSRENSQGKLANVVTKKLKGLGNDREGFGDRRLPWRFPLSTSLDLVMATLATKTGRFSALLPRLLVDGVWFRVLFGSLSLALWGLAIGLATSDALANPGASAKPSDWILFGLILLSFVDAMAGVMGFLAVSVIALLQGEILLAADWRMLLGLGVLMTSLPLLVHVIRPLRRLIAGDRRELLERAFDYIMPPVFVAFAAGSMLKALNGLSGLELVTKEQIELIRWAGFFGVLLRMAGEDLAKWLFPARSLATQPAKLVSPGKVMSLASVLLRFGLFLFIAEPFFGIGFVSITAGLLIALPAALKVWEDDLPNSKFIHKWLPRGLLRFSLLLVLGILMSRMLLGSEPTADAIRDTFLWLMLPGAVVGVIELFARKGGDWQKRAPKWTLGAIVWGFTIALTLGWVRL